MGDNTKIEWTDATWNPITGCDIESPGCIHCYAMTLAGTRLRNHPSRIGLTQQAANGSHVWTGDVRFNEQWLDQPMRWQRPRMIFVVAHGDLFHPLVPDEWIDKVFAIMARNRQHTYQVLTKRAGRMREYMTHPKRHARIIETSFSVPLCAMESCPWPLPHVWMGVSAEDQQRASERIPDLLQTPAAVRWLSLEPLIGPIDLNCIELPSEYNITRTCSGRISAITRDHEDRYYSAPASVDWVVAGGESGSKARPSHPDWFRSLRDQCVAAGVPFHFKQHGAWAEIDGDKPTRTVESDQPSYNSETARCDGFISLDGHFVRSMDDAREDTRYRGLVRVGKKAAGRLLDERTWDEFPR